MYHLESPLGRAIELLRSGYPIPFHMARELIEQGYDLDALKASHFKQKA